MKSMLLKRVLVGIALAGILAVTIVPGVAHATSTNDGISPLAVHLSARLLDLKTGQNTSLPLTIVKQQSFSGKQGVYAQRYQVLVRMPVKTYTGGLNHNVLSSNSSKVSPLSACFGCHTQSYGTDGCGCVGATVTLYYSSDGNGYAETDSTSVRWDRLDPAASWSGASLEDRAYGPKSGGGVCGYGQTWNFSPTSGQTYTITPPWAGVYCGLNSSYYQAAISRINVSIHNGTPFQLLIAAKIGGGSPFIAKPTV